MSKQDSRKRVMVLLVGGRLTPNFIGVLGYHPDAIECLVSEDEQRKYEDVLEVLSPLPHIDLSASPHFVPAFDMQRILEACKQVIAGHPDAEIVFNVTCATKVMGIAAYEAAKRAKHLAIYVDTAHGRFLNLTQPGEQPIPIRIGLKDYLSFYGRSPQKAFNLDNLSIPEERAIAASVYLAEAGMAASETLALMRQWSRGKGRRTIVGKIKQPLKASQWKVLCELNRFGLISNLQKRSETEISYTIAKNADWNFLDGTWLEVYVWDQARKCVDAQNQPLFDECDFGFEIPGQEGAKKEVDVGCMFQGQFIHCFCKTEQSPFKTRYLDELRAVSSLLGGRFCSRLFVTSINQPAEDSGAWQDFQSFLLQARDREIVVVTGEELTNIGTILRQEAEKPTFWRV